MELYEKVQKPITSKLEKIEHKIEEVAIPFMYDKILNQNQLSIEPPTENLLDDPFDHPPIKAPPKQKTFTVDIFKDVDKNIISKYDIPTKINSKLEIENILDKIVPAFDANSKELTRLKKENTRLKRNKIKE